MKDRGGSSSESLEAAQRKYSKLDEMFYAYMDGLLREELSTGKGHLSPKCEQFISIAIALVKGCPHCVAYHTGKALELGATPEEIVEAAYTVVREDGGIGLARVREILLKVLGVTPEFHRARLPQEDML